MYICPRCGAINYGMGPCQCCDYGRSVVYSASDTLPRGFVEELKKS